MKLELVCLAALLAGLFLAVFEPIASAYSWPLKPEALPQHIEVDAVRVQHQEPRRGRLRAELAHLLAQ